MIPTFKDFINADLDMTFFNPLEFGTPVLINDVPVIVVIDEERLQKQNLQRGEGLSKGEILFMVRKNEMTKRPKRGNQLKFNLSSYRILEFSEDELTYSITLERVTS